MEKFKTIIAMKTTYWLGMMITLILIIELTSIVQLHAQAFAVKRWRGTYPRMNGSYPLSFIAFKGFLNPVPHIFFRTWPAHYYYQVGCHAGN